MSFSVHDILVEFVEAGRYGRVDVAHTAEAAILRNQVYTRARVLKAQRVWIANHANREKKRLAMVAYRASLKAQNSDS